MIFEKFSKNNILPFGPSLFSLLLEYVRMKNSKNSVSHGNTYPVYQATILFGANAIGTTAETNLTAVTKTSGEAARYRGNSGRSSGQSKRGKKGSRMVGHFSAIETSKTR